MREALVPPRAGSISRRSVFVEGHVIMRSSLAVSIQVRRVSVVPVLLKLLPEHTLRCQLILRENEGKARVNHAHCIISTNRRINYVQGLFEIAP